MYAGVGRAGDFAGDPLLWVDSEMLGWVDVDEETIRAVWTAIAGLPGSSTWITYMDGVLQERGATSAEDFTVPTAGTKPNIAAVAVAPGVSDGTYDPLGSEDVANISTLTGRYENHLRDQHRIAEDALAGLELFRASGGDEPDLDGSAWETFAALPHETAALTYPEVWKFVLARRNKYGMLSQNRKSWRVELDGAGDEVAIKPSAPTNIAIAAAAAGNFRITAEYDHRGDGDNAADTWAIFLTTDGGDPDPDVDTPIEVAMGQKAGRSILDYTSSIPAAHGYTGKVIVRARRAGSPDVDSSNATIYSATSSTAGPDAPAEGNAFFGAVAVQDQ